MSERALVTLAYRRDVGELSSGAVLLAEGGAPAIVVESFTQLPYAGMMGKFARHLQEHPTAEGAIQRIDRPGLTTLLLPQDEVDLFRSDPAEAIRRRIFPPQQIYIGVDKASSPPPAPSPPPLEAGFNVLANTFGDVVYARLRNGVELVECFGCGHWSETSDVGAYDCPRCGVHLRLQEIEPEEGWAGVRTADLLASGKDRFFLPRRWNTNGNWVSLDTLEKMFDTYNKEKSQ